MSRRKPRVDYTLNSGDVTSLPNSERKAILRAADSLIARGGRKLLVKILKGSKDKNVLEGSMRGITKNHLIAGKICITLLFVVLFLPAKSQWSALITDSGKNTNWHLTQKFTPEEWIASNFATSKEMEWFNDARYGMFIHFGLSTYINKDLSWGMCYTRKAPDHGNGPIADSIWTKYPEKFLLEEFDAREWVNIAKRIGAKYIVTIAKHHDGFHLWDTKYSEFKITNTPFGRDYLKELADACHEAGMKFGIYYSQRDWYHPDYAPVDTSLIDMIKQPPYFKAKAGVSEVVPGPSHQKYNDYQFNVVRELCSKYGKLDVFWFDAAWWGGMFTSEMWESEKLTRMIRELQPGIIINNRASLPGDFDTPEQKIGMHQQRPWESCITLCSTWSYSDTPVKPKKDLVKMLTATACGNGNLLLSWGPKWDGAFDPKQIARLEELGDWLKKYGHTIYNTRGGPWYPEDWGGSTYNGKNVYVHITGGTGNRLHLPLIDNKIVGAKCLTGGEIIYDQNPGGVALNLEKTEKNEESVIIELTFQDAIEGMASQKHRLSMFADPAYGILRYENENLKSTSGTLSVDLGQNMNVTGIGIQQLLLDSEGGVTIEVSADGKLWKLIKDSVNTSERLELTVSQFNAGIELPGVDTRFIRISKKGGNTPDFGIKQLSVYGK